MNVDAIKSRVGGYMLVHNRTKQAIADTLGISVGALNSKLDGRTEFKLSEVGHLAKLCECTIDELVGIKTVS